MPEPVVTKPDADIDPWLDNQFAPLDTRSGTSFADELVNTVATEEEKAAIQAEEDKKNPPPTTETETVVEPVPVPVAEIAEENEPELVKYEDGSSVLFEKIPTGFKATLDSGNGSGKEVFYGKTESEMLRQVLPAKLNATKKIKEQNRQIKLGVHKTDSVVQPTNPRIRDLTADEKFEIKTKLAADPDAALSDYFKKKTGRSLDQIIEMAERGRAASETLNAEAEAKDFAASHPDYYPVLENRQMLVGYLSKNKLGIEFKPDQEDQIMNLLVEKKSFTSDSLAEAYEELSEAGLLIKVPEAQPEPTPVPATVVKQPVAEPAPETKPTTQPSADIPPRRVGPRAALGLRQSETVSVPPAAPDRAPTVEELDNLPTEEINRLMAGIIQNRARSARR